MARKPGVALNPATPIDAVDYVLGDVDLVLVMSVNPGFGGQSFIAEAIDKLRGLRAKIDATGRSIDLEVDGGINGDTARAADRRGRRCAGGRNRELCRRGKRLCGQSS